MKKIVYLCLSLALLLSLLSVSAFAAGEMEIKLDTVSAKPGESVDVALSLANNPGVAGLEMQLNFGSELTLTGVDETDQNTKLTFQPPQKLTSPTKLVWYNGTANSTYNGTLVVLHFTVAESCTAKELPLTLTIKNSGVADVTEQNVPFVITNGAITVPNAEEAIDDFTVTLPEAMNEKVTITAPEGGWVVGENTFTVESEKACVLLVTNDGGETYTRLTATANGDDYAFTADLTADSSIVCARKGDISGDGSISALEARQILMAGNGLYTLTPLQMLIADTNGDGTISALEARQILMAGNGLFTIGW